MSVEECVPGEESFHGTTDGYRNHGCRGDACRKAQADDYRERRAARLAAHPEDVPHGTVDGYVNWGCREACCRAANAAYQREHRAAQSA